ncbi:MAG: phage tail protein [Cyanomargarita calcarea GSE-NOS-MK-12-04C]|uniref:Phage tail protein n=1 Tax=Cyanomargarita calcarea GSE-NOS-MK-12-04C TaxID=2839659 RepID=A0A951QRN3_9CYAN|nr:phage tail protein [Cyanomargarita calcarea GSE-NOS-MK-12-04C]
MLPIAEEKYQISSDDRELEPVADWLTAPIDELLISILQATQNFYRDYLDPVTAAPDNLDWLAQLCGFTGEHWETSWTEAQKRALIANAFIFIWESKGTRAVLEFLLETFDIQGKIYLLGEFLAGRNKAGEALGGEALEYFLLLPLAYLRTSYQWRLASKFNRLYGPVYVKSTVCYSQFYCGFSCAGDPCFDIGVEN